MNSQRGIALVVALLVVALATATAAAMVARQRVDVQQTANIVLRDQSYMYAIAAEQWVTSILHGDYEEDKKKNKLVDSKDEPWTTKIKGLPIEDGVLSGEILDQSGKFNVNNLVSDEGSVLPAQLDILRRLFDSLDKVDPDVANAIADWIDKDIDPNINGGAEDNEYSLLTPPYRTPNQWMASLSELRLIRGVTAESYEILIEHLTALPTNKSRININFAKPELLAALSENLSVSDVQPLVEKFETEPAADLNAFLEEKAVKDANLDDVTKILVAVNSEFFYAKLQAQIDRGKARLHVILHRNKTGKVQTVTRGWDSL